MIQGTDQKSTLMVIVQGQCTFFHTFVPENLKNLEHYHNMIQVKYHDDSSQEHFEGHDLENFQRINTNNDI